MSNIVELINQFNLISINNRIDPFFEADIESFYDDDSEFSLCLKRSSKNLSLYGSQHVAIRQAFFNSLKIDQRIAFFIAKSKAAGIFDSVLNYLKIDQVGIVNVIDIGKGRTIYKLTITNGLHYVIKEKTNNNQAVFNNIAEEFLVPSPKSKFFKIGETYWEITEFLDEQEVFHTKKEALVNIFAKAAAFGDFIELGDRHFENYIIRNNSVVAIDVTHLKEEGNEHWTKKYIAGGLYEVCILQYYSNDPSRFYNIIHLFFEEYSNHAYELFKLKDAIANKSPIFEKIRTKWASPTSFINHMWSLYSDALSEMFDRICYKSLLQDLVDKNVSLENYQELKMFYLADMNRISTFFRVEELGIDIFSQIRDLSLDHLGISPQFFQDINQSLNPIKETLKKPLKNPLTTA
ncbi:MAG: hypothetical protein VXX85_07405 [Candidatus Margulisiibacteriota bacterium]|nr:hypothetical protein [Candidatus Margulisiibacteriota bacterium]